MWWLAAAGAAKALTIDKDKENRQRNLQAKIEANSPWTGVHGDMSRVKEADPFSSAMQGYSMGKLWEQQNPAAKKAAVAASSSGNPTAELAKLADDNGVMPATGGSSYSGDLASNNVDANIPGLNYYKPLVRSGNILSGNRNQ